MSWTVRTVCIAMSRGEGLTYDICKFYFLGTWSFWTTSKKQSGHQNSKTFKLSYTTSLLQAEFQFFKGLVYDSKLLLVQKCFSELLLHNRADELIRWFPSSECDFWTMNKNYRKSAWRKWFFLLQHKPKENG